MLMNFIGRQRVAIVKLSLVVARELRTVVLFQD